MAKEKSLHLSVSEAINTEAHIKKPILLDDPSFATCENDFTLSRHTQSRKWTQLELSAETSRIKYRAVNFGQGSATTLPYRYAVALVDTSTSEGQVFESDYFVTERVVKQLEAMEAADTEREANRQKQDAGKEFFKSRLLLGESFGTRKTKQILSSYERNKINMGQLASQSSFISRNVDNRIADSNIGGATTSFGEDQEGGKVGGNRVADADQVLPPYNPTATRVEDVYRIQDLIPHEAYYSMDVSSITSALLQKNTEELDNILTAYSLHEAVDSRLRCILTLVKMPNEKALTHTARCLLYLNYLLTFRLLNETKINTGDLSFLLPMSTPELCNTLLKNFTEPVVVGAQTKYKLNSLVRDRCAVFTCVIFLTLDNFRSNAARMSVAMQLPLTKLNEYLKAIGCSLDRPNSDESTKFFVLATNREIPVKMAVLRVPLVLPQVKTRAAASSKR